MEKQDFTQILTKALKEQDTRLENHINQKLADQSRDLKDYVDSSISASEKRTDNKFESWSEKIIEGVADVIDRGILPQINELDRRITKLERKLA